MRLCLLFILLLSGYANAAGYHACTGKILGIVTRASAEDTQVRIEGMNGYARLGFGGSSYSKMHDRQFTMLLSAYMADKPVTLEFLDNTKTCSDDHYGVLIRFVQLR